MKIVRAIALAGALLVLATLASQRALPDTLRLDTVAAQQPEVLDRDGRALQVSYDGGWNLHDRVPLERIPARLRTAFVEAEDHRYWRHRGVDWRARVAALWTDLRAGHAVRGASTISEQVVRILHPRPRTVWSRWVEGFEAMRLEARFSKADILEFYLNQVPYGANRRGVGPAAQYYFGRSLDTLSAQEMLALAVMVRAPSRFAREPLALQQRVRRLASAMQARGEWPAGAIITNLPDFVRPVPELHAAHFRAFAAREAARLRPGTTRVHSSLDVALQAAAEDFLRERLRDLARDGAGQGAVLVVDLDGNRIRAYASADRVHPHAVGIDAVQTPRQPGSTLKPLLYAQALERGWRADTTIDDAELRERINGGLHEYRNYSRTHYGTVTVAEALGNSLNIPAVKALQFVGQQAFLTRLQALGVHSLVEPADYYGDGLALGNGALSLYELVQAYTALARDGVWQPLTVFDDTGPQAPPQPLIARDAARTISAILSDASSRLLEFGEGGVLRFPVRTAVKTGTSSDYRDAWTVAYNGRWLVGVWIGNLSGVATEGVTGARGPALLTRSLLAGLPPDTPLRAATLNLAADADASKPVETLPDTPRIGQPFDGLLLARDPRIPDALEALRFELAWRETPVAVRWQVDGATVAETSDAQYDWPLVVGAHRLQAAVRGADGVEKLTPAVHFTVR
ncbi:transglycosylase domain-containing protein [Solimonas terrae]|uniref:peptidoglycan glycosyltransferase n=1 Tax=Solimonas terrae TaxID=1396819 RepID=A0A6M2BN73_9GAMM|nr:transglycosylase domain-containing protein [Solimonas terrae]NGY03681.1 penicillin-binding protein 1C [Solimonas terrae]